MDSHLPNSGIYVQCIKHSPPSPGSWYFDEDPYVYNYIAMYNKYRHNSRGANSGLEQAHRWV